MEDRFKENISVIISFFALLISVVSTLTARKSLRISQRDFQDKTKTIVMYLEKGFRTKQEKLHLASFLISFSNPATLPQTIVEIVLDLKYVDNDQHLHSVLLQPHVYQKKQSEEGKNFISLPYSMGARTAHTGWVSFLLPERIIQEMRIERYRVIGRSQNGTEVFTDSHILNEVR